MTTGGSRSAEVVPGGGVAAIARPRLTPRDARYAARTRRVWVESGRLHLNDPSGHRSWDVGPSGLRQVRWISTAGDDLDHGADPLYLDAGGHVEIPAQGGTPAATLRVHDWVSDPDLLTSLNPTNPLQASALGPVLSTAGVQVEVVARRDPGEKRPSPPTARDMTTPADIAKGVAILVGGLVGLAAGLVDGSTRSGLLALAAGIAVALTLWIRIPRWYRWVKARRDHWVADATLHPAGRTGYARGFVRNCRVATVGPEIVVVDPAGAELWLGREPVTGVARAVTVLDGDKPVLVELRRGDGVSLARLPWADWFSGDGGAALRTFLAATGLEAGQDSFTPDRRTTITTLQPVAPAFASAGLPAAQLAAKRHSGWMGSGRVPDWQPVIPAGCALIGALGPAGEPLIAAAAGLAILLNMSTETYEVVRRRQDRKILR